MTDYRPSLDQLAAMVTLADTNTIERLSRRFDVRLFGAIGDGQPHTLSSRFGSLSDARRVFPQAEALTDQIDWCALQAAIDAAKAAGGGQVFVPAGTYLLGNRTLVMPDSPQGHDVDDAVVLAGEGCRNTVLRWHLDSGAPQWAVRLPSRHNYSRVVLRDLHLRGPAARVPRGEVPCRLSGVACSSGWRMERVNVDHFYADVGVWDDHTVHIDCEYGIGSYYGLYFDDGTIDLGDHLFLRVNIGGTLKACVAVAPTNQLEHSLFIDCHMGWSPFVLYRERGSPTRNFVTNTRFIKTQAEAVGNAWAYGENFDSRFDAIDKCVFEDVQFLLNEEYRIRGMRVAFCRVNAVWNSRFVGPHADFGSSYAAMDSAYFDVKVFQSNAFVGGYHNLVMNSSAEKPMIKAETCIFNLLRDGEQFDGELRSVGAAVPAAAPLYADGMAAKISGGAPIGLAAVGARAGAVVPVVMRGMLADERTRRIVQPAVQITPA